MKPYDRDMVCPKCGFKALTTRYVKAEAVWSVTHFLSESIPAPTEPIYTKPEHMHRECPNCGYTCRQEPENANSD